MPQTISIDLPKNISEKEKNELLNEIRSIEGVEDSDTDTSRFIDPASIGVYITIASSVVALASNAVPVFQKIKELFKKKGVKNAKVTLPNGIVITLDEGTSDDVIKIANELEKK